MPLTTSHVHDFRCDYVECTVRTTAISLEIAFNAGWISEDFFGVEKVLCPDHAKEIKHRLGISCICTGGFMGKAGCPIHNPTPKA